ncbi:efflux RND transporter periplasmic adaptor subunit [Bradyrhizobium sp.]|uniref:efflux RND transporter periplasmic adaptor subunit n=1 Tax=Bradyrhizobium sp. TaxID=376 RepID=UPI001D2D3454|nr:efflux RND transporter periplasmic adaptor subunit [Bradyrhizobium sp.]MBI5320558.1 efflux RND transporter periplasmic adaptor subunit [Bradyrhizobium sp.]
MRQTAKKAIRWLAILIVLTGAGGGAYYYRYGRPPLVKVGTAVLAPVSEFVYGSGTVEPLQWAKVVPAQRRRLVHVCHCEGSVVKRGQVLGQQDDAEETGQLKELEARHQQLIRDLDRADKDDRPKAELEQRRTAIEESSSRISVQKSRIETLVLRAPMDGMVLRRDGEVGEIVGPTDVLFWVGTASPLQVVAEINEEDIMHVTTGQTGLLTNEAFANQAMRATVSQITPKGDPTKKSFRVYLRLPSDTPLRIGMNVEVNIIFRENPSAVVVPNEAILGGAVQVVRDGEVKRVPVSTGVRGSRATEVTGGISPGTMLLVPARKELADGARVRIENPPKPEPAATRAADDSSVKPREADGTASRDGDKDSQIDQSIASALSAHMESIVNDARREASRQ